MPELTVCVPFAPYHDDLVSRAVESIKAQTIPVDYFVFRDDNQRGPGYGRNRLLSRVQSPFVAFLDADDELEPDFAETCLKLWLHVNQPNRYVYTNWYIDGEIRVPPAPCGLWNRRADMNMGASFHLVTTFLPADYARAIGGFDETLSANEDADFAVRLKIAGICGIHLNAPLVRYNTGGQRSLSARVNGDTQWYQNEYFPARFGAYERHLTMGCCGDNTAVSNLPIGEQQPGDVLAMALWTGNQQVRGLHTGRLYPRMSKPKTCYVAPEDIAKSPDRWAKITNTPEAQSNPVLQPNYLQAPGPMAQPVNWSRGADAAFGSGSVGMDAVAHNVSQEAAGHYQPMVNDRTQAETIAAVAKRVRGRK